MEKRDSLGSKYNLERRKSSYLAVELFESRRASIESLYNSIIASISLSDSNSIADTAELQKIQLKNKELYENVTDRLTAFIYFSNLSGNILSDPSSSSCSSAVKNSIEEIKEQLNDCNGNVDSLDIKNFIQNVTNLKQNCESEVKKLQGLKSEINTLEEEEATLNQVLTGIENNVQKIILDSKGEKTSCNCDII